MIIANRANINIAAIHRNMLGRHCFQYAISGLAISRYSIAGVCKALFQVERIEAFGEPAVYWGEQIARLILSALIAPEPRHAHCGAEFP